MGWYIIILFLVINSHTHKHHMRERIAIHGHVNVLILNRERVECSHQYKTLSDIPFVHRHHSLHPKTVRSFKRSMLHRFCIISSISGPFFSSFIRNLILCSVKTSHSISTKNTKNYSHNYRYKKLHVSNQTYIEATFRYASTANSILFLFNIQWTIKFAAYMSDFLLYPISP